MSKTYRVGPDVEFDYPADEISFKKLKLAGGRSKMSQSELAKLKFKRVKAGDDCSDMPADALNIYLERGLVIEQIIPDPIIEVVPLPIETKDVTNEI